MILNTNAQDAHVLISVYFDDCEPVENIPFIVPGTRIKCFKSDDSTVFGDLKLGIGVQYSLSITSDVGIIVQYGPCHGNGTMEGEAPWIETSSDYLLEENMTFCVDIFLGSAKTQTDLRIEDVVCVKKDYAENFTNYPRKWFEIPC